MKPRLLNPMTITQREATVVIGLGLTTIKGLCRSNTIPSFKLGGTRLISVAALQRLFESLEPNADAGEFEARIQAVAARRLAETSTPGLRLVGRSA